MGSHCCYMTTSLMLLMMMMVTFVNSDVAKDRDECANQLVGLATCLPYVSGTGKAPTLECCTGLKQVLVKSRKCLCVLVKDRDDPELGLKINATLALGLPAVCKAPSNASECPALLNLPPNSPDAKVFEQFANSTKGSAPTTAPTGTPSSANSVPNAKEKSDGSRTKKWLGMKTVVGFVLWYLSSIIVGV